MMKVERIPVAEPEVVITLSYEDAQRLKKIVGNIGCNKGAYSKFIMDMYSRLGSAGVITDFGTIFEPEYVKIKEELQ
jgi:hypothetical protein